MVRDVSFGAEELWLYSAALPFLSSKGGKTGGRRGKWRVKTFEPNDWQGMHASEELRIGYAWLNKLMVEPGGVQAHKKHPPNVL